MGGDLQGYYEGRAKIDISIHASVWEATNKSLNGDFNTDDISIHASVWEATRWCFVLCCWKFYFNPRLRMGGDLLIISIQTLGSDFNPRLRMGGDTHTTTPNLLSSFISIHASVWEATRFCPNCNYNLSNFNPRLRMGGDMICLYRQTIGKKFQSTPPYGRRLLTNWILRDTM